MISETVHLPRTKLWGTADDGYVIVLECRCGTAVDYPGHPDEQEKVACPICGQTYEV